MIDLKDLPPNVQKWAEKLPEAEKPAKLPYGLREGQQKFIQTERHKIIVGGYCTVIEHNIPTPKHHSKKPGTYQRIFYLPFGLALRGTVQHHGPYTVITIHGQRTHKGDYPFPPSKYIIGTAKCSPEDTYDPIQGVKLAWERCSVKIAQKFLARGDSICESLAAIPNC